MPSESAISRRSGLTFALSAATVLAVCLGLMRSSAAVREPDLLYYGITFDLCITIPALFWFFLVRTGRSRPLSLIPVFLISASIAAAVIPAGHDGFLRTLAVAQAPLELVVVAALVIRLRRSASETAGETDILVRFRAAAESLFGKSRVGEAAVTELGALYYAATGWRKDEVQGPGTTTFHRLSGWGSIVLCIAVLIVAESIAVHLFVQQWSPTAAWIVTALDLWGILWLVGDYQAFRLRPTTVTADCIQLRFGMRWTAGIDAQNIESIRSLDPIEAEKLRKERDYLRLSILDEPSMLMTLSEPVEVIGPIGMRKLIKRIGLRPDRPEVFALIELRPSAGAPR
jgi:hypothetical protein